MSTLTGVIKAAISLNTAAAPPISDIWADGGHILLTSAPYNIQLRDSLGRVGIVGCSIQDWKFLDGTKEAKIENLVLEYRERFTYTQLPQEQSKTETTEISITKLEYSQKYQYQTLPKIEENIKSANVESISLSYNSAAVYTETEKDSLKSMQISSITLQEGD